MKTADDSRRGPRASKSGKHPRQNPGPPPKPAAKAAWIEFGKSSMKVGFLGLLFCAFYVAVWSGGRSPVPVSGTVKYQGEPLPNVSVICMGKGNAIATGTTDEHGRFAFLTTETPRDGAFPGEYVVAIAPINNPPNAATISYDAPAAPGFPPKYLSTETSPLQVTVSATEPNQLHLELED